jgi:hypothetical protein
MKSFWMFAVKDLLSELQMTASQSKPEEQTSSSRFQPPTHVLSASYFLVTKLRSHLCLITAFFGSTDLKVK